jgi:preprotein translocase subunit SecD
MSSQWKSRVYGLFLLIAFSVATLVPTISGFLYPGEEILPQGFTKFFKNRLILGLDLQGGIHLEYKVDTREALINKSRNISVRLRDEIRSSDDLPKLKDSQLTVIPVSEKDDEALAQLDLYDVTQLTIRFNQTEKARLFSDAVTDFLAKNYPEYEWIADNLDRNEIVIGMRKDSVKLFQVDALEQAIETIERRINAFGVAESSVSRRDQDKIVVELPGLNEKEFGKAKEKLSQTGFLHFKIAEYDTTKADAFFSKVRARVPSKDAWPAALKGLEQHKVHVSGRVIRSTSRDILEYMLKTTLNGDIDHLVGFQKMYVDPQDALLTSIDNRLSKAQEKQIDKEQEFNPQASVVKGYQIYYLKVEGMSGENVEDAQVGYDEYRRPVTNMRFGSADASKFANLTENNVNRSMAILIDDIVYSAPNINERIGGGRVQISMGSGSSVFKEAQALAAVLKSGALQAPLRQLYSSQVGPTLGKDSIQAGKVSIIVGFILVIIFMLLYYRARGIVANIALILNLLFISAGLALFGATLTLPGIAGIVLTVGMAVDANVLIFERIKEEERVRSITEAFVAGYEKAWSAILDANVTTGIAAIVLYQFGTGPIKGFAVTLGLGIISSMYTAIVVTRLIFEYQNQKAPASVALKANA